MSKRWRSDINGNPIPSDDAYISDSGSDAEDNGVASPALQHASPFCAVPTMASGSSLFVPPPTLQRTLSCHTSSPASSMAASPTSGHMFISVGGNSLTSLLLRQPSNQSDTSLYSPVQSRDGGSLSRAPDHVTFDLPQLADPAQLAAHNVALSQRLMQLEAELRSFKPQTEQQHSSVFTSLNHSSSSAAALPPPSPTLSSATLGFTSVPVLDFSALLQLPPHIVPTPPTLAQGGDAAKMASTVPKGESPFVFASARFGNEVTLLGAAACAGGNADAVTQQVHFACQPMPKSYAPSVDDLRSLVKQQQKELDYFRQTHKSVVLQQGRQQSAAVEKSRADSAEALVLQLQKELSSTSSALSVAENALRSDAAFRSALVKHFPDLASASAVICRIQEMQRRQLQLEAELCTAKQDAASAAAAVTAVKTQLASGTAHLQQQEQQQQALLKKLHAAEAAAAAATAAADARQSVVKMFDFEKFVEVTSSEVLLSRDV